MMVVGRLGTAMHPQLRHAMLERDSAVLIVDSPEGKPHQQGWDVFA
tara:strand:- start:181 stop:318 length:138 start_codon:yes stop_codon:yes gene_type:complete